MKTVTFQAMKILDGIISKYEGHSWLMRLQEDCGTTGKYCLCYKEV